MLRPPIAITNALLLAGCLFGGAVSANDDITQAGKTEFFEKRVRPLLIEHCYECHATEEQAGGLRLDSAAGWKAGGETGPTIIPGRPAESLLLGAIQYNDPVLQMPPRGKLSDPEVQVFKKWIAAGAVDPRDSQPAIVKPNTGMSIDDGRKFWSMKSVVKPELPAVNNQPARWVRTPIDQFTLAGLQARELQPAPPADKQTLIRRVTFDLTGLPPTLTEIDNFLADDSPAAFESVVDRLLASVHYGERYGRHWLDVARYADSNGLDENLAFGNAWRYRDYVVKSFNDDKPFDQFLVEQIAGDLLPSADAETRTGTGFLALGAKVLAEPDREKLTMDTIDEQIDATSKAFMGITIACARCHDHKFDPISQADYYALAAIFKSTATFGDTKEGAIKHWFEHSFASEAEKESLKAIDAEIAAAKSTATKFKNAAIAKIRSDAVASAAKYLAAATRFAPGVSLDEVRAIAKPLGLHSRILYHCRLHLAYGDSPIVQRWNRHVDSGTSAAIEATFERLFAAGKTDSPAEPADDSEPEFPAEEVKLAAKALADKSGFLTVPPQVEYALNAKALEQYYALMEQARKLESRAPDEPAAMGVRDDQVLVSLPIHIRGDHRNLGEPIRRGFPTVMRSPTVQSSLPDQSSGRLELARWMARPEHPLTARVYVNRIWGWHFGQPLVGTTENFGALGERPSNPELLDWLADDFVQSGWSTKRLHRQIVLSSTYRMAATNPRPAGAVDPENQQLWKFPTRRLEAEEIRDAILAVAGQLDISVGGKTVPLRNRQFVFNHTSVDHTRYDSLRRAIYLPVIRNNLYSLFSQFNFPDPTMPTGTRQETMVAPQALLLMNDPLILNAADAFATRVVQKFTNDSSRIHFAYRLALGRGATDAEIRRATEFLAMQSEPGENTKPSGKAAPRPRWSAFCQSLMMSNEFVYIQ